MVWRCGNGVGSQAYQVARRLRILALWSCRWVRGGNGGWYRSGMEGVMSFDSLALSRRWRSTC